MERWAARAVSLLGIVSLALALLYVGAVGMSFHPRGAEISKVMVGEHAGEFGYALHLAVIPYVLLLSYLALRTRLGHWLVGRGAYREALDYVGSKMKASLARSRTEVMSHRSAAIRANLALGDTEAAWDLAKSVKPAGRGRLALEYRYWRAIVALRMEDLIAARESIEQMPGGRRWWIGRLHAIAAEIAARRGDREAWESSLERATWARCTPSVLAFARAAGVMRFGIVGDAAEALEDLQAYARVLDGEVPGRRGERIALVVELSRLAPDVTPLTLDAVETDDIACDRRSAWCVSRAVDQETLEGSDGD